MSIILRESNMRVGERKAPLAAEIIKITSKKYVRYFIY